MFIGREPDGVIYGLWTVRQWEGQEELPDDDPQVMEFPVRSPAEVAALAAKQSIDAAIGADTTIAQLKAMTNAEFDTWWLANVTTATQAIQVLKRLAKLAIRRLA